MTIEQIPIQRIQRQQAQLQQQMDVFSQLKDKLRTLSGAALSLTNNGAFQAFSATTSSPEVATITTGTNGSPAAFDLQVFKLATSMKLASQPQGAANAALGKTGSFVVNGKEISVTSGDTLQDMATKLNNADAGVTATVVTGNNQSYLTISSKTSGAAGAISLADKSGTVLKDLGLVTGATAGSTTTWATKSFNVSTPSSRLGDLLGLDGQAGNIDDIKAYQRNLDAVQGNHDLYNSLSHSSSFTLKMLNGADPVDVKIDLNDSLDTIAKKMNSAFGEDFVGVEQDTTGFHLNFKSERVSVVEDPLGLITGTKSSSTGSQTIPTSAILVQGQDAEYSLDGLRFTSGSNTIQNAAGGATITLLKAAADGSAKTKVEVKADYEAVKKNLQSFADNYNGVMQFIKDASQFNKETFATGPLFGNNTSRMIEDELTRKVFQPIEGLSGTYKSLSSLGFQFESDGKLSLNSTTIENALKAGSDAVAKVFQSMGTSTSESLKYVASTNKTKATGTGAGYDVQITQVATKATLSKDINAGYLSQFGGSITLKGGSIADTTIAIEPGKTIADVAALINNSSALKASFSATVGSDGKLEITSLNYGTAGNFTMTTTLDAYYTNQGAAPKDSMVDGKDVAGTINGESATGRGQYLTGDKKDGSAEGMQIQYTGTTLGSAGRVTLIKGMATQFMERVDNMTLDTGGIFKTAQDALQGQYDDMGKAITRLTTLAENRKSILQAKFLAMEDAIQRSKSQGQQLSGLIANLGASQ